MNENVQVVDTYRDTALLTTFVIDRLMLFNQVSPGWVTVILLNVEISKPFIETLEENFP